MEVPDLGIYTERDWPQPQKGTAAMVSRMDRDVGTIVNLLGELGLENTIVLFTSDNGPHREGGNDPDFFNSNGSLKGIKRSLHEGGIRVPMIAWWPGHIQAGSTQDHVAAFWDLMPTLADLAQAREFVPAEIDGKSFQAALTGGRQPSPDFLYWAFYERGGGLAIRMGDWKAIIQPIGTPLRLYDLSRDLSEEQDVASEHPDVVTRLGTLMADADTPSDRWKMPQPGGR
jgi:arylsulfatase A-like enzyme